MNAEDVDLIRDRESCPSDRRQLLKAVVPLLLGLSRLAFASGDRGKRKIRIAIDLPQGRAANGARLGTEEALRAAALLGFELSFDSRLRDCDLSIVDRAGAGDPAVLRLVAGSRPGPVAGDAARLFYIGSSPARRRRALAGRRDLRIVDWHPDLVRFGAEQLNERFRRRFATPMTEQAWRAWMAVKIATELALRARTPPFSSTSLLALRFDGHKGTPLAFDADDHHLEQPVYRVDERGRLLGEPV